MPYKRWGARGWKKLTKKFFLIKVVRKNALSIISPKPLGSGGFTLSYPPLLSYPPCFSRFRILILKKIMWSPYDFFLTKNHVVPMIFL